MMKDECRNVTRCRSFSAAGAKAANIIVTSSASAKGIRRLALAVPAWL